MPTRLAKTLAKMIPSGRGSIAPLQRSTVQMEIAKIPVISPVRAILPAQLVRDCPEIGEDGIDQLDGKHLVFGGFQRRSHCLQRLVMNR
jgi:hypothetical protein